MSDVIVRTLVHDEYHRLAETGADLAQVQRAATNGDVIVVERDGEILACALVFLCAHLEGVWVRPDQRGKMRVFGRLWRAVKATVAFAGARGVVSSAVTDVSAHMIESIGGQPLAGQQYVIDMGPR